MCQLDRLPADQARQLNRRHPGHAMCKRDPRMSDEDYDQAQAEWDQHRRDVWPTGGLFATALDLIHPSKGAHPAMCDNTDDTPNQTPPADGQPEPYGRDFGYRLPRLFTRLRAGAARLALIGAGA